MSMPNLTPLPRAALLEPRWDGHRASPHERPGLAAAPLPEADAAFLHAPVAMALTDAELRIAAVNRAYAELTGLSPAACLGRQLPAAPADNGGQRTVSFTHGDGTRRTALLQLARLDGTDGLGNGRGHVATLTDITGLTQELSTLRHMAQHDPLTRLPNRRLLTAELEHSLARARRRGQRVALMFVDLDRIKGVNDRLGHQAGDAVLCETARRLRAAVRAEDLVGRWGGDEFLLVLEDVAGPGAALLMAEKLLAAVSRDLAVDGTPVHITASIGVALYPDHAQTASVLTGMADAAMYRAKQGGRGRVVLAGTA